MASKSPTQKNATYESAAPEMSPGATASSKLFIDRYAPGRQPESVSPPYADAAPERPLGASASLAHQPTLPLSRIWMELRVLGAQLQAIAAIIEQRPVVRTAVLGDLGSEKYALRRPLTVLLEEYEHGCVARHPETQAFATADTEFEAIRALKEELVALCDELLDSKEDLGPAPVMWRDVLLATVAPRA